MSAIRQGHIDQASGQRCGWANGVDGCAVPACRFPDERCILVQRETGLSPERPWVANSRSDA